MLPFDPADRRTRLIALVGLLVFGLAAGIEIAARMRGGGRLLQPGAERGRARAFFPPRTQPGLAPVAMDDLLALLAKHRDDPTAQQLAEAFMTEPDLAGAWREVERDGDVSAFVDRIRNSPALPRLKANPALQSLAGRLGSDSTAATLALAFGVETSKPAPAPLEAATGPVAPAQPAAKRLSSGGPILAAPAKSGVSSAQPAATAAKPPAAGPGAAPKGGAKGGFAGAPERKPVEPPAAAKEEAGSPPEPKAKNETPEPCPMEPVCTERSRVSCSPKNAASSFADARRQGCGCAIEELTELMQAAGNGALLAALGGEGGFTPILERTDWVMRKNAQATGRCFGFRRLQGPDRRRDAGKREGELWRLELRRRLRVFAEKEGVPFEEPER